MSQSLPVDAGAATTPRLSAAMTAAAARAFPEHDAANKTFCCVLPNDPPIHRLVDLPAADPMRAQHRMSGNGTNVVDVSSAIAIAEETYGRTPRAAPGSPRPGLEAPRSDRASRPYDPSVVVVLLSLSRAGGSLQVDADGEHVQCHLRGPSVPTSACGISGQGASADEHLLRPRRAIRSRAFGSASQASLLVRALDRRANRRGRVRAPLVVLLAAPRRFAVEVDRARAPELEWRGPCLATRERRGSRATRGACS